MLGGRAWIPRYECKRCPDLAANRRLIVRGYGSLPAEVMFVGEAPGRHGADQTGVPFTRDRSGRRLQALLIELGLQVSISDVPRLRHCFLSNVVRCNPPQNRRPTRAEVTACRPYLDVELDQVRPSVLVPVGLLAARELMGSLPGIEKAKMRDLHARPVEVQRGQGASAPQLVLPLRHPSRISNAELDSFRAALLMLLA